MTVRNQFRLIVYRIHEKGLEVLLSKPQEREECWALCNAHIAKTALDQMIHDTSIIELDQVEGSPLNAIAIEADWHELPRVRQMIKQDLVLVTDVLKSKIPALEDSAYVAVKEAFKKLMPDEYALLKELKEILLDRNTVKNI